MAIKKNFNRQSTIVAHVDFELADVPSGTDVEVIDLPPNAVIVGGDVVPTEAWNAATTNTIDVGDKVTQNRYLNDGALAARVPLVPTGHIHSGGPLTVRYAGTGAAATTGKARLTVEYYIIGRSCSTHG